MQLLPEQPRSLTPRRTYIQDGNIAIVDRLKIPGARPAYTVSADGRIWSTARGGLRPLQPVIARVGRYQRYEVFLGRGDHRKVATIVCEAFHGPRPPGFEVAHLNGDSLDNRAENLAWKTRVQNEADKVEHGTSNRGTRQHCSKLTETDVREIRRMAAAGHPQVDMVARFSITQGMVSEIVNRRKWSWLP